MDGGMDGGRDGWNSDWLALAMLVMLSPCIPIYLTGLRAYLTNPPLPRLDPFCSALSDLILCWCTQQWQLKVAVLVVVYHAAGIIIYNKLHLECVLRDRKPLCRGSPPLLL